jgi:hypothetical protein
MIDTKIDRLEEKLHTIRDDISEIKVSQALTHESLKEHMRRTSAVEAIQATLLKKDNMREGIIHFIAFALSLCAAIEGIVSLLTYLKR